MDPEHLHDREWREIMEYSIFRENILFTSVDKVHLINEWGLSFCLAFGTIGTFLRGRFPSSISIVGLTATLEPGSPTVSDFLSVKVSVSSKATSHSSGAQMSI